MAPLERELEGDKEGEEVEEGEVTGREEDKGLRLARGEPEMVTKKFVGVGVPAEEREEVVERVGMAEGVEEGEVGGEARGALTELVDVTVPHVLGDIVTVEKPVSTGVSETVRDGREEREGVGVVEGKRAGVPETVEVRQREAVEVPERLCVKVGPPETVPVEQGVGEPVMLVLCVCVRERGLDTVKDRESRDEAEGVVEVDWVPLEGRVAKGVPVMAELGEGKLEIVGDREAVRVALAVMEAREGLLEAVEDTVPVLQVVTDQDALSWELLVPDGVGDTLEVREAGEEPLGV